MAATLPLELLIQIATFLESTGAPLTPCVTVCRRWQAAFEPLLYRKVHIYTTDDLEKFGPGRALSLANFDRITSGTGLYDWHTIQLEDYTTDNEVRRENDRAFQSGIIALFRTLSDWDSGLRVTLQLLILGRKETLEPNTDDCKFTGPDPRSFPDEWIPVVPLYRASFGDSDPSMLPVVPCIDRLWFSDDPEVDFLSEIWVGAAMQIARNCSTMCGLRLNMQEHVKPDHLDYIQGRRRGNPLPESLSLHWPQIEVLDLRRWVTLHLPERQKELDAIEDWSDIIRDVERGYGDRKLLDGEHVQRVLISLGHAVRRMPKLTSLSYAIDDYPKFELLLPATVGSIRDVTAVITPWSPA
ncbi:hypothetical protein BO99DRAFT_421681 [Aspergillus violaceofuscus CBS 115571]|uniref:F-box domain-containing protein n=1 Tax=Aspergillus violaceofuscus (strain CBS 115571) TaxID=1450538 RepID=A0A2V5HVI6_ASPV1|nr:hypothetical protein BO99DRAFT_421681 [Aspergillus violaceofuscus CBS 115571]